jgi:hypothetical protein
MEKIVSLFCRNYDGDRQVRDEVVPGAEWVARGEGRPTVKIDGTSCLVRAGRLLKRYDCKRGKTPPAGFEPAQDPDPVTGHWPGWLAVGDGPEDKWHREAEIPAEDGTYELVGPKVQGNPYNLERHVLIRHGAEPVVGDPRTFAEVRQYLETNLVEGIVWHHDSGAMVKIKARDFGLRWPRPVERG